MKVLFTSTIAPPVLSNFVNRQSSYYFGGWLNASISTLIEKGLEFELAVVSPIKGLASVHKIEEDGVVYYGVPQNNIFVLENEATEQLTSLVLEDFNPDVIHINGLESAFSLEIALANKQSINVPVVASIQGLASVYIKYFHGGLFSVRYKNTISVKDILRLVLGQSSEKSMLRRASYEIRLFSMIDAVIGRTHWDYSNAKSINSEIKYYYCNEVLRDEFYSSEKWSFDSCTKHVVFCTNTSVPYKGFHFLLEAISKLREKYPDVKVKAVGDNLLTDSLEKRLKFSKYQIYLRRFIKREKMENNIEFLGSLSAKEMIRNYLDANVYVLPSVIENSPNSLCEAQILGVPCVSAFVGGTTEFIEHGSTGFLYRVEESSELMNYIDEVFSNKHLLDLDKTSQLAAKRMSKQEHFDALNEIYKAML